MKPIKTLCSLCLCGSKWFNSMDIMRQDQEQRLKSLLRVQRQRKREGAALPFAGGFDSNVAAVRFDEVPGNG